MARCARLFDTDERFADRADALTEVLEGEGETVARLGTVTAGEGIRYTGGLL